MRPQKEDNSVAHQQDPTFIGAVVSGPLSCLGPIQSSIGASSAYHCVLQPRLPDMLLSRDPTPHSLRYVDRGSRYLWSSVQQREDQIFWISLSLSADCNMCHDFSTLISCFWETWHLWGDRVNSLTLYALLHVRQIGADIEDDPHPTKAPEKLHSYSLFAS